MSEEPRSNDETSGATIEDYLLEDRTFPPSEAFKDYAKLLKESPRYSGVMETVTAAATPSPQRFAQGLQRAGYATDPAYADKLTRIINTTLRLQRVVT